MTSADLRPMAGTIQPGNGQVVSHERVVDSLGHWHGLIRLVVEGQNEPDPAPWLAMLLPGATVKAVMKSPISDGKITILYKFSAGGAA